MRAPRCYHPEPLRPGTEVVLPAGSSNHLCRVLRLGPGAALRLFDGGGGEFAGMLIAADRRAARVRIERLLRDEPPAPVDFTLLLALSRGERMELALQKATELGVAAIEPVVSARSQVRLGGDRSIAKLAHWQGVVIAASEQSGRCRVPALMPPATLTAALAQPRRGLCVQLAPTATTALCDLPPPAAAVCLLVGPEGGLDDTEIERARASGFAPVGLGPRILRTETAPLAALAAMQMLWGDFRGRSAAARTEEAP